MRSCARSRRSSAALRNTSIRAGSIVRSESIKRSDVAALLDQIVDDNGARQADVCLAIIRKLTNWFATRDNDYVSPVVKGMHRTNGGDHKRKRILNDDEIRALWKAADGTFGALLKVALLTAQRREKVASMRWDDIVDGVWTIASDKREKATAGSLQLPQAVLGYHRGAAAAGWQPFHIRGWQGQRPVQQLQPAQGRIGRQAAQDAALANP